MRNIGRGKPVAARTKPDATTRISEASTGMREIDETLYQAAKIIPRLHRALPDVAP
ncbi:unnamed protein product, partial [Rotaria magnacalcarata]